MPEAIITPRNRMAYLKKRWEDTGHDPSYVLEALALAFTANLDYPHGAGELSEPAAEIRVGRVGGAGVWHRGAGERFRVSRRKAHQQRHIHER